MDTSQNAKGQGIAYAPETDLHYGFGVDAPLKGSILGAPRKINYPAEITARAWVV